MDMGSEEYFLHKKKAVAHIQTVLMEFGSFFSCFFAIYDRDNIPLYICSVAIFLEFCALCCCNSEDEEKKDGDKKTGVIQGSSLRWLGMTVQKCDIDQAYGKGNL